MIFKKIRFAFLSLIFCFTFNFANANNNKEKIINTNKKLLKSLESSFEDFSEIDKNKSCIQKLGVQSEKKSKKKKTVTFNETVQIKYFNKDEGGKNHFQALGSTKKDMGSWNLKLHKPIKEKKSTTSKLNIQEIFASAEKHEKELKEMAKEAQVLEQKNGPQKLKELLHRMIKLSHLQSKRYYKFSKLSEIQENHPQEIMEKAKLALSRSIESSRQTLDMSLKLVELANSVDDISYGKTIFFKSANRLLYLGKISKEDYNNHHKTLDYLVSFKSNELKDEFNLEQ